MFGRDYPTLDKILFFLSIMSIERYLNLNHHNVGLICRKYELSYFKFSVLTP